MDLNNIFWASIPSAVGGLITAAIIALLTVIFTKYRNSTGAKVLLTVGIIFVILIPLSFFLFGKQVFIRLISVVIILIGVFGTAFCANLIFLLKRSIPPIKKKKKSAPKWNKYFNYFQIQVKWTWNISRWKNWILVGLFLIPILSTLGYFLLNNIQNELSSKFVVIVAKFDGPEPEKYRVTDTIVNYLKNSFSQYENTEVDSLQTTITESQGGSVARDIGRKNGASVLIWGWYGATQDVVPISVNFEILCNLKCSFVLNQKYQGVIQVLPKKDLENFTLQLNLSKELLNLSNTTLGLEKLSINDWSGAIPIFSTVIEQTGDSYLKSINYYYRGNAFMSLNEFSQAESDFNDSFKTNNHFISALYNLATLEFLLGRTDDALSELKRAIDISPNDPLLFYNRATLYSNILDFKSALKDINVAISLDQNEPEFYRGRGIIYYWLCHYEDSLADINRAEKGYKELSQVNVDEGFIHDYAQLYIYRSAVYQKMGNKFFALLDKISAYIIKPNYEYHSLSNQTSITGAFCTAKP
jgi:tetratricopeptide (TPR) repeat protein